MLFFVDLTKNWDFCFDLAEFLRDSSDIFWQKLAKCGVFTEKMTILCISLSIPQSKLSVLEIPKNLVAILTFERLCIEFWIFSSLNLRYKIVWGTMEVKTISSDVETKYKCKIEVSIADIDKEYITKDETFMLSYGYWMNSVFCLKEL